MAVTVAHVLYELRERSSIREIHDCIGLTAVPVPSRDDWSVPSCRELSDSPVFFPVAKSIQFQGVNKLAVGFKKMGQRIEMYLCAVLLKVPKRVIQDHEDLRNTAEGFQQFRSPRCFGRSGVFRKIRQYALSIFRRQVMHSEMKQHVSNRHAPLH